jgi:hypothetical protein
MSAENAEDVLSALIGPLVERLKDERDRVMTESGSSLIDYTACYGLGTMPDYFTKEFELRGDEAAGFVAPLDRGGTGALVIPDRRASKDMKRGLW